MTLRWRIAITWGMLAIGGCSLTNNSPRVESPAPDWNLLKRQHRETKQSTCILASSPRALASGVGMDEIRVIIAQDGRVTLTSSTEPFDLTALRQIGIRIDENAPFLSPTPRSPTELTFSMQESDSLLSQMKAGKTARIQIALMPRKELLTGVYSLRGFEPALTSYRMCEVLKARESVPKSVLSE